MINPMCCAGSYSDNIMMTCRTSYDTFDRRMVLYRKGANAYWCMWLSLPWNYCTIVYRSVSEIEDSRMQIGCFHRFLCLVIFTTRWYHLLLSSYLLFSGCFGLFISRCFGLFISRCFSLSRSSFSRLFCLRLTVCILLFSSLLRTLSILCPSIGNRDSK